MIQEWKNDPIVGEEQVKTFAWQNDPLVGEVVNDDISAQIPLGLEGETAQELGIEQTGDGVPKTAFEKAGDIFGKVTGESIGFDPETFPEFRESLGALRPLIEAPATIGEGLVGGLSAGVSLAVDAAGELGLPNSDALKKDLLAMLLESPIPSQGLASKPPLVRGTKTAKTLDKAIDPKSAQLTKDVAEAEGQGIRVLTSDIRKPETFAAKWVQSAGEKIPGAGTGPLRAAQQEERVGAIQNTLKEFGADDAVHMTDDVMADLLKTREQGIKKYTKAKTDVFNKLEGSGNVDVKNTIDALDVEINKMKSLKSDELAPVIEKFEDWKASIQNQDIQNVEQLRKQWGQSFKSQDLITVKKASEKSLNNIYGALRDDIGDFIKQNGTPADYTKWRVANNKLSSMIGELDKTALKSALNKGTVTPEVVKGLLFSKKPSDIKALHNNLSPKGRANARAAILNDVMNKSMDGENISPQKFMTNLEKAREQTGIFFKGDDLEQIKGLERALKLTERASVAGVSTLTGQQLTIPVVTGILVDMLGGLGSGLAAGGTIGGIARLYESKAVRNAFIRLAKTKVGSKEEAAMMQKLIAAGQVSKGKE